MMPSRTRVWMKLSRYDSEVMSSFIISERPISLHKSADRLRGKVAGRFSRED